MADNQLSDNIKQLLTQIKNVHKTMTNIRTILSTDPRYQSYNKLIPTRANWASGSMEPFVDGKSPFLYLLGNLVRTGKMPIQTLQELAQTNLDQVKGSAVQKAKDLQYTQEYDVLSAARTYLEGQEPGFDFKRKETEYLQQKYNISLPKRQNPLQYSFQKSGKEGFGKFIRHYIWANELLKLKEDLDEKMVEYQFAIRQTYSCIRELLQDENLVRLISQCLEKTLERKERLHYIQSLIVESEANILAEQKIPKKEMEARNTSVFTKAALDNADNYDVVKEARQFLKDNYKLDTNAPNFLDSKNEIQEIIRLGAKTPSRFRNFVYGVNPEKVLDKGAYREREQNYIWALELIHLEQVLAQEEEIYKDLLKSLKNCLQNNISNKFERDAVANCIVQSFESDELRQLAALHVIEAASVMNKLSERLFV